jgi:hypothetical protein
LHQDPLQDGWWIELTYKVPKWEVKLKFLAQIASVHPEDEMKEVIFAATTHLIAVHGADLQALTNTIQGSKR